MSPHSLRTVMSAHASVQILSGRIEATGNQNGHQNVANIVVSIRENDTYTTAKRPQRWRTLENSNTV
jgi:hypothetical protein